MRKLLSELKRKISLGILSGATCFSLAGCPELPSVLTEEYLDKGYNELSREGNRWWQDVGDYRVQYRGTHYDPRNGWHSNAEIFQADSSRPGGYNPVRDSNNRPLNAHIPRLAPGSFSSSIFDVFYIDAVMRPFFDWERDMRI